MMNYFSLKYIYGNVVGIALLFLPFFTNVYAQSYKEIYLSNGEHVRIDNPNGGVSAVAIENGKIVSVQQENPDEVVRLIVTFKDQPLAAYKVRKSSLQKTSMASIYASLQTSHASFKTSLNTIRQQLYAQLKSDYSYMITRDYYRALNGVALQCKRGMIGKIRALTIVKLVSLDREVKANLTESVHQIRADIVQDSLGYTGKGVLVGDVDTGIDYLNPALGGGFGSSFRVIGGYDFVNNDIDPMDDEGHGTHVAGIIGANGGDTLCGVAPEVKFLAVKVLNANGVGWFSDIIAGIEYCLDPDGNPGTDDAADVINMSLGGEPMIDNPVDSAVDNATKAGVLCIVAAGNTGGFGYGTIGSPGTSISALTVGACDSANHIAPFSSQGPDLLHSSIKPEVVAPGVHILSTVLNNQTASWSGTSMATPHVTGVAALLKQEHPSWTPEEIKAAIVNTAHSIGDNVSIFVQGKGCVDALDAAKARMVVEPGVMSFGMVDLEPDVWMDMVELTISNFRSVAQNTQIRTLDGMPTGATLTFDKTSFVLAPGEEKIIQAILSVPSSVPILTEEPFAYLGSIEVISDSDDVRVPFSFIKASRLVVNFEVPAFMVNLIDRTKGTIIHTPFTVDGIRKYSFTVTQSDSLEILALLKQDTLDVVNYSIVDHKIHNPAGLTYAFVNLDEAVFNLIDTVYDIHNTRVVPIDSLSEMEIELDVTVRKDINSFSTLTWIVGCRPSSRAYISPLDSTFFVVKQLSEVRENDSFLLIRSIYGLHDQQDINIGSGPDNLIGYHMKNSYDDPHLIGPIDFKSNIIGTTTWKLTLAPEALDISGVGSISFIHNISNLYYNKESLNQGVHNDRYNYSSKWLGIGYGRRWGINGILRTPEFNINENGEVVFEQVHIAHLEPWAAMGGELSSAYIYETLKPGDTIKIEQNAHVSFPDYMTYIKEGSLFMGPNDNMLDWSNSTGGIRRSNGVYETRSMDPMSSYWNIPLYTTQVFAHNRAQINTKPFTLNESSLTPFDRAIYKFDKMENNAGTLRILSDVNPYTIAGQAGQCTADFEYQIPLNLQDQNIFWSPYFSRASVVFPSFNLLQVSVDGRAVDVVRSDQNGKIRLVLFDHDSSVTSARLSLVLASGDEIELPVSYVGDHEYYATIPTYIPTGFVDVVARAEDTKGNKCELTASPGFYFGSTMDSVRLDARVRLTSYSLDNVDKISFNTGDTLKYSLFYVNYGNGTVRNAVVKFPTTPYFRPIGSASMMIDSINITDTIKVPINLIFLGKQQSSDELAYYSPTITWTSNGTTYLRNHKILVDFQSTVTIVAQAENTIPNKYELYQNYPNPFNPSTTIKYDLPKESSIKITMYDILGREVATLVDETKKAGSYQSVWNTSRLASGVYFYRLRAGDYTATKKLLLLK